MIVRMPGCPGCRRCEAIVGDCGAHDYVLTPVSIWTDPCPHFGEPGPFCRQCGAKLG